MNLAIRIFALSIVCAGVGAISVSSSSARTLSTHQSVTSEMPVPTCAPGLPGCPDIPPKGQ